MEIGLEFQALEGRTAAKLMGGKSKRESSKRGPGPGCAVCHLCDVSKVL